MGRFRLWPVVAVVVTLVAASMLLVPFGVASAQSGGSEFTMTGVVCTAKSSCLAVGDYADLTGASRPLSERWNGSSWQKLTIRGPRFSGLNALSCPAVSNCMAVGFSRYGTLAEEWNGAIVDQDGRSRASRFHRYGAVERLVSGREQLHGGGLLPQRGQHLVDPHRVMGRQHLEHGSESRSVRSHRKRVARRVVPWPELVRGRRLLLRQHRKQRHAGRDVGRQQLEPGAPARTLPVAPKMCSTPCPA